MVDFYDIRLPMGLGLGGYFITVTCITRSWSSARDMSDWNKNDKRKREIDNNKKREVDMRR